MTRPPPLLAFSDECAGLAVSFAVFDFGRQLLVWAAPEGRDGACLGSLALGAPAAQSPSSSSSSSSTRQATATTLLRGSSSSSSSSSGSGKQGEEGSVALAKRLAARLGKPVAVAWNLPSLSSSTTTGGGGGGGDFPSAAAAALGVWAERRLLGELDRAGLLPPKRESV